MYEEGFSPAGPAIQGVNKQYKYAVALALCVFVVLFHAVVCGGLLPAAQCLLVRWCGALAPQAELGCLVALSLVGWHVAGHVR